MDDIGTFLYRFFFSLGTCRSLGSGNQQFASIGHGQAELAVHCAFAQYNLVQGNEIACAGNA